MARSGISIITGAALALLSATSVFAQTDGAITAKLFFEDIVSRPAEAGGMATSDGMVIAGHIGMPLKAFLGEDHPSVHMLDGCTVGSVKTEPVSQAVSANKWLQGGVLRGFSATYTCPRPSGARYLLDADLILKDERVAMLELTPAR
jgi:hypothetical protein